MNKTKDKIMESIFFISAILSILFVILICVFLFSNGLGAISEIGVFNFILGKVWNPDKNIYGILPMIVGSIEVTILSLFIGAPIGVGAALYLSKFASDREKKYILPLIELMASIPSIVYGFFGIVIIVPLIRNIFGGYGQSMIAGAIVLAIMILPTIITISKTNIDAVDNTYYEASVALGASHERTCIRIILPAAKSGVLSAVILGIGRAIGETMAVIMVVGNQARMPKGLFKGIRTMTGNIALEMGYATGLHRQSLIATGVVLFIFILLVNNVFYRIVNRGNKHGK